VVRLKFARVVRNTEEVVTEQELKKLLETDGSIKAYAGYEPSGDLHLGHLLTVNKLIDLQSVGVNVTVLLADMHAFLNEKGTMEQISERAEQYKKSFVALGLDEDTKFLFGTDYQLDADYTQIVLKMARDTTLNRARRSMDEVSRNAEDPVVSQMIYPLMQAADIGYMKLDIAVGGIDQRKIHMLAREELPRLGFKAPVCLHTPILLGLDGNKMSSSKSNFISVEDDAKSIETKITASYCPAKVIEDNPVLQLYEYYIFPKFETAEIERSQRYGGDISYDDLSKLKQDYASGKLHPLDLKNGAIRYIDKIMEPLRVVLNKD
jgi:tyrosyl-tRNA synthetase